MSRRPGNPSRRLGDGGGSLFPVSSLSKQGLPQSSPSALSYSWEQCFFSLILSGTKQVDLGTLQGLLTGLKVQRTIPVLKNAYGDGMHKVLHVGPEICSVVSELLKEEETEAWGVEPYDTEDADRRCRALVQKGVVHVSDVKFPLPQRVKSFSVVIVSDTLDYLSPRYLNRTLPELARVSADGLVIFTGYPGQQRAKVAEVSKFGRAAKLRSSSLWVKYFNF